MRLLIYFCIFLHSTAQASVVPTPPLIQAVQSRHMPLIGQLINGGTEVNVIDILGRTASHYAVSRNNQEALKLLLDNGADPNLTDNAGNTLLDLWHEHENKEMLTLLHAAGAKPSFTKAEEEQPAPSHEENTDPPPKAATKNSAQDLWQAAANNDRASTERLLIAGANATAKNAEGKAPFEVAREAEHAALAAILLRAAAGINGRDNKSWTPLMWAIAADEWDLVREFIREGAHIVAFRRQSALDLAKEMKSEAKLIEVFIAEKGVDAVVGEHGHTILMSAARRGNPEIVKLLIDSGADINIRGSISGVTALMVAVGWGHTEIIKLLIDNGADINIKNYHSSTALIVAARSNQTEVVQLLIDNGADLNVRGEHGNTALMCAAGNGARR